MCVKKEPAVSVFKDEQQEQEQRLHINILSAQEFLQLYDIQSLIDSSESEAESEAEPEAEQDLYASSDDEETIHEADRSQENNDFRQTIKIILKMEEMAEIYEEAITIVDQLLMFLDEVDSDAPQERVMSKTENNERQIDLSPLTKEEEEPEQHILSIEEIQNQIKE